MSLTESRSAAALLVTASLLAVAGCSIDRSGYLTVDGAIGAIPPPLPGSDAGKLDATPTPGAPRDGAADAPPAPDLGPSLPPAPPPPDAGPECDPEGCCPPCAAGMSCTLGRCTTATTPPPPPPPCGGEGFACCEGGTCFGGLRCNAGVCGHCGERPGDDCCEGGGCGAGMSCDYIGGTQRCYVCGAEGQFCCQSREPCERFLYCDWGRCR